MSALSTFCQLTQSHFARDEVLKYCDGNESVTSDRHYLRVLSLDLDEVWKKEWNRRRRWELSVIIFDPGSDREQVAPSGSYQSLTPDSFLWHFSRSRSWAICISNVSQRASTGTEFGLGYHPFEKPDLMLRCHQNPFLPDTVYFIQIDYQEKKLEMRIRPG